MPEVNFIAVIVATAAAFMAGAIWNVVLFGNMIMKLHDPEWNPDEDDTKFPYRKLPLEFIRCFIVAFVLAWLVKQLGVDSMGSALQTGLLIWIGFPAMILSGAVLWQNEPWKLAMIHVGDWLVKLLLIAIIIVAWL